MCIDEEMLGGRQRDGFSLKGSHAKASDTDATSSISGLGTMFVATIEDARDFLVQLEATFCDELWPAICSEIAKSRSRVLELEECLDKSRKQCEETDHLAQLRRQDSDAERVRFLCQNEAVRTELEQEKLRFHKALEDVQRNMREAGELEKKTMNDDLQKTVGENEALQQRLDSLLEENLNREKHLQSLSEEVGRLQEEAKLFATKKLLLEAENQRLTKTRAVSEKSQILQTRRLSLKKETKDSSPGICLSEKRTGTIPDDGCQDPQSSEVKGKVQSDLDLQPQARLHENNHQGDHVLNPTSSDHEDLIQIRRESPAHQECDRPFDGGAIAISEECASEAEPYQGLQGDVVTDADAERISEVACSQRCKAGSDRIPIEHRSHFDSDETVMDAVDLDNSPPDAVVAVPDICFAPAMNAAACDEPSSLVAGRFGSEKAEDDDRGVGKLNARLKLSPRKPPIYNPLCNTMLNQKVVNRSNQHSWRQTRSKAEPRQGDPHDSFLDTPRERALAKLAASREQGGTECKDLSSVAVQPVRAQTSEQSKELVADGLEVDIEKATATLHLVAEASNTGCQERKERCATASRAPAFKYNEPVRKKREREALLATDCKQCKKFYDAVEAEDAEGAMISRCEHHDAVSRHRYKFLPPPTPEGFWNIGFDSDL